MEEPHAVLVSRMVRSGAARHVRQKDQAATFAIIAAVHLMGLALPGGDFAVFTLKQPLLRWDHAALEPMTLRLLALASISIWTLVAAPGRWIGFSG